MRANEVGGFTYRDLRRLRYRVTISPAADRRKCDPAQSMLDCKPEACAIATREECCLALSAAAPNRTHRMDDEPRGQKIPASKLCLPCIAAVERTAFFE